MGMSQIHPVPKRDAQCLRTQWLPDPPRVLQNFRLPAGPSPSTLWDPPAESLGSPAPPHNWCTLTWCGQSQEQAGKGAWTKTSIV